MEKLRKGNTMAIGYNVGPHIRNFLISPLLIVPFIENAFKHVSNFTDKRNFVDIQLNYRDGFFELVVRNSVDPDGPGQGENLAGGIGQENTKRRLKLIYPGRHDLIIEPTAESYLVSLTLQVQ